MSTLIYILVLFKCIIFLEVLFCFKDNNTVTSNALHVNKICIKYFVQRILKYYINKNPLKKENILLARV